MITGAQLRDAIISGANNIANLKSSVDELNVFPVPDGDTGTNMSMTIGASIAELMTLPDTCTVEQSSQVAASCLLRGARGNSGVILSLLFRGFSRALQGKEAASSEDLYISLCKGVQAAYKAVMNPTEGTILTVAREASEKAEAVYKDMEPVKFWEFIVKECKETLSRTPDMLPVLKKAGVVDAGGQGLVVVFEGMLSTFKTGKIIKSADGDTESSGGIEALDPEMTGSYYVEFTLFKNSDANNTRLRAYLESIGEEIVAAENDETIKCQIKTSMPGKALNEAIKHGYITKVKVENMLEQYVAQQSEARAARQQEEPQTAPDGADEFAYVEPDISVEYGFVTVCSGEGIKQLFLDLGATKVVSGGQTMNPSTDDILKAIRSVPAKNVLVLANNKNIIMAAEQACKLADRKSVVVTTRTIPQGVSAMIAFDPDASLEENIINMNEAADKVTTGQITFAARDSDFDGHDIKEGEILALHNGKLDFVEKDKNKAAVKLAKKITSKSTEFVTVIYGEGITDEEAQEVGDAISKNLPSTAELTLVNGGQPVYYYYISAE